MNERYSVKVVVFLVLIRENNGKKEVLLQRRHNTGYMDDMYDLACSGHLESYETLDGAVIREAKEEIGIDVLRDDLSLISVVHPQHEGYIRFFFKTSKYEGIPQIKEPNKCSELEWFDIDSLPEEIIPHIRDVIVNINNGVIYDDGGFYYQKKLLKKKF